jgi:glycerol-3-phosphate dehydrogenase
LRFDAAGVERLHSWLEAQQVPAPAAMLA